MKYIFWGLGEFLKSRVAWVDFSDIVCIVDKNTSSCNETFHGVSVVAPEKLKVYQYDGIIITSIKYFDEIAHELLFQHGVDINKIWGWQYYYKLVTNELISQKQTLYKLIKDVCSKFEIQDILDVNGDLVDCLSSFQFKIDTVISTDEYQNFGYSKVWKDKAEINKKYEIELINKYSTEKIVAKWTVESHNKSNEEISTILNYQGYLFDIQANKNEEIHIYEVTHKRFLPINVPGYYPIHAGKTNELDFGYIGDNIGDNISIYNALINEGTALYWIWKNDTADIVGLNHYRRFFSSLLNPNWAVQEIEIYMILDKYEMIVAEPFIDWEGSVKKRLKNSICEEAFVEGYEKLCDVFGKRSAIEQQVFKDVFEGKLMYSCNMFITTRELLDQYCNWLFPIVFELIETVEIKEQWDNYSKRVIGFIAERLLTVWIVLTKCKVKELPIIKTDNNGPYGK